MTPRSGSPVLRGQVVRDAVWDGIRVEFGLPSLDQVRERLAGLMQDPEPVMRQLMRVFIGEGTYCPGFQFLPGGKLHPVVTTLFFRAVELRIPHNLFGAWMVTGCPGLDGNRPVDRLGDQERLLQALEDSAA